MTLKQRECDLQKEKDLKVSFALGFSPVIEDYK